MSAFHKADIKNAVLQAVTCDLDWRMGLADSSRTCRAAPASSESDTSDNPPAFTRSCRGRVGIPHARTRVRTRRTLNFGNFRAAVTANIREHSRLRLTRAYARARA